MENPYLRKSKKELKDTLGCTYPTLNTWVRKWLEKFENKPFTMEWWNAQKRIKSDLFERLCQELNT